MNGKSGITSSNVFVEKRYNFEDIFIGWQFAGLLYLADPKGHGEKQVMLDLSLAHDIVPQGGDVSEPLDESKSTRHDRRGTLTV